MQAFMQITAASLFIGRILILIVAEALSLYRLAVGLVIASTAEGNGKALCTGEVRQALGGMCLSPSDQWYLEALTAR